MLGISQILCELVALSFNIRLHITFDKGLHDVVFLVVAGIKNLDAT